MDLAVRPQGGTGGAGQCRARAQRSRLPGGHRLGCGVGARHAAGRTLHGRTRRPRGTARRDPGGAPPRDGRSAAGAGERAACAAADLAGAAMSAIPRPTARRRHPAPRAAASQAPAGEPASSASTSSVSASTARYQEKRERVLDAAAVLFNQRGVKGATLSDIATSVGLVTNSVTYYYRKKEDLATACFLRTIAVFDALAASAAKQPTPAARIATFYAQLARLLADIELGGHVPIVNFNDIRALPNPHAE